MKQQRERAGNQDRQTSCSKKEQGARRRRKEEEEEEEEGSVLGLHHRVDKCFGKP